ncbi:hypothetical protein K461DRAFT_131150 [Myriangium duriaei CBS 260.36]|uniref:Uncharacterized protein n=1 Tax=Myriangium duriaei CBS 260.36 TaxID=1168546 RepID=A0A9P4J5T2_9PEZI|nr:hypothetical protein K461DRAFT_131150 [Myriangium duriaei CBS 260.36]
MIDRDYSHPKIAPHAAILQALIRLASRARAFLQMTSCASSHIKCRHILIKKPMMSDNISTQPIVSWDYGTIPPPVDGGIVTAPVATQPRAMCANAHPSRMGAFEVQMRLQCGVLPPVAGIEQLESLTASVHTNLEIKTQSIPGREHPSSWNEPHQDGGSCKA